MFNEPYKMHLRCFNSLFLYKETENEGVGVV